MSDEDDETGLDSVLIVLGNFGRHQLKSFILLSIIIAFSAIFGVAFIFTAGDVVYRCRIDECEGASDTNMFNQDWLEHAIPSVNNSGGSSVKYESCSRYDVFDNNTECFNSLHFDKQTILHCRDSWIYESEEKTIVTENWGLQCDENSWKLTLVGSINNLGQVFGLPLAGIISDRYGRRTMVVLSSVLTGVMGIIRSFSNSYIMFLTFEFLDPVVGAGMFSGPFILGLELVGPSLRVLIGSLISCAYTVGEVILGLVSWWLQDWRLILQVLYTPALLVLAYLWLIPESVRWLIARGRMEEARSVLRGVAKTNKVELDEELLLRLKFNSDDANDKSSKKESSILKLLKSKILLLRFLNCSFCWITNTFVFFGMSMNSVIIAGDKYVNFILSALIEIPAYFITYLIMDKIGRRPSQSYSLLLSSLACFMYALVPLDTSLEWLKLILFLLGRFAITVSFTVSYVYTTEMFPTNVRHTTMSTCSMVAKIGSIIAPQTPLLAVYLESLPLILFGILSLIAGLSSWAFPETNNTKLPDTIEEAENINCK